MAQLIEAKSNYEVERLWNLGGTMICHQALVNGRIDIYPEYTGTGYISILKQTEVLSAEETLLQVRDAYEEKFQSTWLQPFGFSNSYAVTVRQEDAKKNKWEKISDLKNTSELLRAGFTAEFSERQDGYPSFKTHYEFAFASVIDLDPGLMYSAIQQTEVDVISAFSSDGRIPEYQLKVLSDDKKFFPPYDAVPVVRLETLGKFPDLEHIIITLHNLIDQATIQRINHSVDSGSTSPSFAAQTFLKDKGLI